jgi:Glycosyl transferase family 2
MKIAVATSSKNEIHILEWFYYYQKMGVDYFIIYDDFSEPSIQSQFVQAGIPESIYTLFRNEDNSHLYEDLDQSYITHKCWSPEFWQKQMIPCLKQHQIDYMLYVDLDEFLYIDKHPSIHDLVNSYQPFDVLKIYWLFFGSKTSILSPPEPNQLINTFTYSDEYLSSETGSVKTITKVDSLCLDADLYGPHVFPIIPGSIVKDGFHNILDNYEKELDHETPFLGNPSYQGTIYIAHYFCQDLTTFLKRKFCNHSNYYWWLHCVGERNRRTFYAYIDTIQQNLDTFAKMLQYCLLYDMPPLNFENIPVNVIERILGFYKITCFCETENMDILYSGI